MNGSSLDRDAVWLRMVANFAGFQEMPENLKEQAMVLRKLHPYDAAWELRKYLRCPVDGVA